MPSRPTTLLIVEDDSSIRRSLGVWCDSAGLNYLSYESAEACLAALEAGEFVLQEQGIEAPLITHCLIDVTLPGLDGFRLADLLSPPVLRSQTLMITARQIEVPDPQVDYRESRPLLIKPFNLDALDDFFCVRDDDH